MLYHLAMSITLPKEQEEWLEQQVKDGLLPSIEDGVRHAVSDLMEIAKDDLSWAKPYVDAARKEVGEGKIKTADEVISSLRTRFAE